MSIKEVTDVCRLCLKTEDLFWIFDKGFGVNMKDIVAVVTGVQVALTDVISQKLCKKCLATTYKIFEFRTKSLKNDEYLQDKYKSLNKDKLTTPCSSREVKDEEFSSSGIKPKLSNKHEESPSVKSIKKKFPTMVLPRNCLQLDFDPHVSLSINEVENYFKEHYRDIQQQIGYGFETKQAQNLNNANLTEKKEKSKTKLDVHKSFEENHPISPISIKLTNNDKNEYSVIKKDDKKTKLKLQAKRTFVGKGERSPEALPSTSKKIKLSESSSNSEEKNSLIKSLGLTPTKEKIESDGLIQLHYVQRSLETCNICSSVHYNHRDLKKHQQKHFRCQFCKTKFKSMERKEKHIQENCVNKKVMSSLPTIDLPKIEYDRCIRHKYPNAFSSLPSLSELHKKVGSKDHVSFKINLEEVANAAAKQPVLSEANIIEILSDDEDTSAKETCTKETCTKETCTKENSKKDKTQTVRSINNPSTSVSTSISIPSSFDNVGYQPKSFEKTCLNTGIGQVPSNNSSSFRNSSSSVVKPDITIKNNFVLNTIDSKASDVVVVKELLKTYTKLQLTRDVGIQQDLPSNSTIKINPRDNLAIFKDLKCQLNIYKIPIEVKYGTFKVSFDYNIPQKNTKKMLEWSHLTPVDLKTPTATDNNNCVNENNATPNLSNIPHVTQSMLPASDISEENYYPMNNENSTLPMNLTMSTKSNHVISSAETFSNCSTKHSVVTTLRSSSTLPTPLKNNSSLNQQDTTSNSRFTSQVRPPSYGSSGNVSQKTFLINYKNPQINSTSTSADPTKIHNSINQPIVTPNRGIPSQVISSGSCLSVIHQGETPKINFTNSTIPLNNSVDQPIALPNSSISPQDIPPADISSMSNQSKTPQSNLSNHVALLNNNLYQQIGLPNSSNSFQVPLRTCGSSVTSTRNYNLTNNQTNTQQLGITMTLQPKNICSMNQPNVTSNDCSLSQIPLQTYDTSGSLAQNSHTISNHNNTSQSVSGANTLDIFESHKAQQAHLICQSVPSSEEATLPNNCKPYSAYNAVSNTGSSLNIPKNVSQVSANSTQIHYTNSVMTSSNVATIPSSNLSIAGMSSSINHSSFSQTVYSPNATLYPNLSYSVSSVPWSTPTAHTESNTQSTRCQPNVVTKNTLTTNCVQKESIGMNNNSISFAEHEGLAPSVPLIWVKNLVELK